jgi:hypothetical protein
VRGIETFLWPGETEGFGGQFARMAD